MKAPFPYFGGKSKVAHMVWERFGDVPNYIEPFAGSAACLLKRPESHERKCETINDADGYVANFWRALKLAPDAVAEHADHPVFENDLHARHAWLVSRADDLVARLEGDPDWHDAKIAGWWAWGISCWIGSGFCSGSGPWTAEEGRLVRDGNQGQGVNRKLPHLGNQGQGVNRQLPHLGNQGQGVNRKLPSGLSEYLNTLAQRLERVRVCSGDWRRVCGNSVLFPGVNRVGIFFDPPYADTANRAPDLYRTDSLEVAHDVRRWCLEREDDPRILIALAGYDGEHDMPDTWEAVSWSASGGYSAQSTTGNDNRHKEMLWFSPSCLHPAQQASLF